MAERIKNKLCAIPVGHVTTLWDLLIWRVSKTNWVIGHQTVDLTSSGYDLEKAASEVERLMD